MVEQATTQPELSPAHVGLLRRVAHARALAVEGAPVVQAALDELSALLCPALAQLALLNLAGDELEVAVGAAGLPRSPARLPLRQLPAVIAALVSRQVALVEHPAGSPLVEQLGPLLPAPLGQVLFAPLVVRESPIGALIIGTPPGRTLAPADVALADLLVGIIADIVHGGRLEEAISRRDDQFAMIRDIADHVSSSLEPREVYRLVVQKLNQYFRVAAGSLMLKDQVTDELIFVMTLEGDSERLHGLRIPPGQGIAGHVAQTQQPYISNDIQNDPLHYDRIDEQVDSASERLLCAPMVVKGNTIGVIELINKLDGPFKEAEAERLYAIANIIGVAIENAHLFEFVRQRRDRLEKLVEQIIRDNLTKEKILEALAREVQTQDNLLVVKFSNPYIVGLPVRSPEMFFGREALLKRMISVLHQNSLLLYGERRIGKTTVLLQLGQQLANLDDLDYRFKPVYIDLQGIEETAFFHHIVEEVLHRFGKRAKGITAALRYSPTRSSYSGRDFQRDLRAVIETLCGPQADGRVERLVLLMDEADVMYGYNERILQEFRRIFMNDYAAYLSVVFAAVDIQRQWKRYESPLYNLFQQIEIPPLTRADAEQLARTPVKGRYEYDDAAVELIYRISDGRPMKVQHLCLEAINYIREQSRTRVTVEDIERINELIKGQDLWR